MFVLAVGELVDSCALGNEEANGFGVPACKAGTVLEVVEIG